MWFHVRPCGHPANSSWPCKPHLRNSLSLQATKESTMWALSPKLSSFRVDPASSAWVLRTYHRTWQVVKPNLLVKWMNVFCQIKFLEQWRLALCLFQQRNISTQAFMFQPGVCCLYSIACSNFHTVSRRLWAGSHKASDYPLKSGLPKKWLFSLP